MTKKSYLIGALCDRGLVKNINQDRILVKIGEEDEGDFGLFVIADGMGGLTAGDVASSIAVESFKEWWNKDFIRFLPVIKDDFYLLNLEFQRLFEGINENIISYGNKIGNRVGTTLSALLIYRSNYIICHIGDSRIYQIDKDLSQLTLDHSWVGEEVRKGNLTTEEAKKHPKRNMLTQCLGANANFSPFCHRGKVTDDTRFLMCSDGFYSLLKDKEILEKLKGRFKEEEEVQESIRALFEMVKCRGATDNISAIFIVPQIEEETTDFISNLVNKITRKSL
ncbi:PP2C family protein-serine/threonine phosphatase [Alkaliphilus serpentinus]|uniref:Serine/threonine-protein phosphatase n=1 Tax=Alkaliphilus serpentinus TaxID=1482731 RepID=A0A833MAM3_9FIRM|nr:protein phosphatase 2C domain-containing protein [Alkaliphilus serpentinus]KAB3532801.1 serine/threonine-protein phosphatase [Alkaliphilus serpentinus]